MTKDTIDIQLKNNPLVYRPILTIPEKSRFGLELELDDVDNKEVTKLVNRNFGNEWLVKEDLSLTRGKNAEIVTPVLNNKKQTWILLKRMGELLKKLDPKYNNCSFQVNFDGSLLPRIEDKARFLKLFAVYEDIIYRFSKGEDDNYRDSISMYASPILLMVKGALNLDNESLVEIFSNNKRYGIIFKNNDKNLIEFRSANATSNPILWQNYITTFYYLLMFATCRKCNEKELDRYIDDFCRVYLLEKYEEYNEDKALEFSRLIFKNPVDRTSFMHQYCRK